MPDRNASSWPGAVTAVIALSAVGLYIVGIFKTVGQLRASGVDVSDALSVIPLERHLRVATGLLAGLLARPQALGPLLLVGGAFALLPRFGAYPTSTDRQQCTLVRLPWWRIVLYMCVLVTCAVLVLAVVIETYRAAVRKSWPIMIVPLGLCVYMCVSVLVYRYVWRGVPKGSLPKPASWKRGTWGIALAGVVIGVTSGSIYGYHESNPLPEARIQTPGHIHAPGYVHRHRHRYGKIVGPLIANTDGVLFVGAKDRALHKEVAISRARSVRVEQRTRKSKPTLVELLGW
jgi:hypothetical protein